MEELVIHKVAFTEEAVFDYEHCLRFVEYPPYSFIDLAEYDERYHEEMRNLNAKWWEEDEQFELPQARFPKAEIKAELEEYIQHHSKHKHQYYFRVRWLDEQHNRELMLFIKRSEKISIMQNWTVVGICVASEWTEDLEEDGLVRSWYETKLNEPNQYDWVEEYNLRQQMAEDDRNKDEKEKANYARLFGGIA